MEVVREVESQDVTCAAVQRKYGIQGGVTVHRWVRRYGSRGKVIRVERPQEIDERQRLKQRVQRLERALADAQVELVLERAYTQLACERAGSGSG
jgi:transposase-like protein